ncbi:MAG: hypothetical protein CMH04_11585 [Marinovum sp.]|nr:hypothetical protein [Marinovum sp.]|tara:strand:+ start:2268 stop:3560 length:1293 start_codon:yes stop_codon:yes gene_type:complete
MRFNASKFNDHWEDKELSELGSFQRGKSRHRPRNDPKLFEDGKYPLIQTGEIKEAGLYIQKHVDAYNDFGLAQSKLWSENTLCITIAANIAETALLGYPMCIPDSVVGFNANPNESSELFMHYVFSYIRKAIQSSASGSIQDNINIDYLTGLKFKIPKKPYQEKIVSLLANIDKKIELNHKINMELESMTKLIYDYWFVQFDFPDKNGKPYRSSGGKMIYNEALKREIPERWSEAKLENIISRMATGLNPRNNFILGEGQNYYITIKSIKNGRIIFDDRCDRVSDESLKIIDKRSELQIGDVLFTSIQPVGVTYFIQEKPTNWNINESVFTLRANLDKVTSEFLYMMLSSNEIKAFTKQSSAGSIHKGIRHGVLKEFNLPYGGKEITESFSEVVNPILQKSFLLDKENQKLEQLRDWLLPMLMNGQVKIN